MTLNSRPALALFLPSLGGGGAERVVMNLAIGFAERGFRTDLVLASAEGPYLSLVPPSVRVIDLRVSRVFKSLWPLVSYLRKERPGALLAALDHASLVAMAAARLPGASTRVVISIHCNFELTVNGKSSMKNRMIPWLLGRLHPWADGIVAVSRGVADDVVQTAGIPRHRLEVIYNPVITPSLAAAASERPSHPWFEDSNGPIVLGVGRLTRPKNFKLLIDAFAMVRRDHHARLVILGEGPERAALEAQVREHGLEDVVSLPGFIDNPYACMARASVLALSSDMEGLPTVLIESLAVGTPVVSTDCESGPREILRGGTLGELVPVGNAVALAQAISRILTSPRKTLVPEALSPYTLDVVLDQFQQTLCLHA